MGGVATAVCSALDGLQEKDPTSYKSILFTSLA